jgi:YegS/Rv2252/BmrU family lipid kinase
VILFVVNEKSGNGRGKKAWAAVQRKLAQQGTEYRAILAESPERAALEAKEYLNTGKVTAVAAVGGDGTMHSILPLSLEFAVPAGLIPAGSGNDTSIAFGLPRDPEAALQIVLGGRTRKTDILWTERADGTEHPSLISVAIGLDGAVAEDVNGSRYKRWCNRLGLGRLAYIIGLLRMLAVFRPGSLTVTADGIRRDFTRSWLTAVANLATYGGGLRICPDARPDDGLLHVCVVHGCSPWQLLLVFPTVLSGRHTGSRFVTMLSGTEIQVQTPPSAPLLAYGDGEPAGTTPVRASVRPGQLLFLISDSG